MRESEWTVTINRFVFFFIFVISMICEFYCVVMLHTHYHVINQFGAFTIVLFHAAAALLAALSLYFHHTEKKRFASFAFIFVLSLPIAGYLGILQLLYETREETASRLFDEYRNHIDSGIHTNVKVMLPLKKSLRYLRESIDIEPLAGAAEEGSARKKLSIIKSLGRIGTPVAVKALKDFLKDPHMDVRYYAGEEISTISERFSVLINEIRTRIADESDDWKLYCELGNLHIRHAQSGLFEEGSERDELLNAKEALQKSLTLNDDQFSSHYLLGKTLSLLKDFREALWHLEKANQIKPDDLQVLLSIGECAWEMKELRHLNLSVEKMRALIKDYNGDDKVLIVEFLNSWPDHLSKGDTVNA